MSRRRTRPTPAALALIVALVAACQQWPFAPAELRNPPRCRWVKVRPDTLRDGNGEALLVTADSAEVCFPALPAGATTD